MTTTRLITVADAPVFSELVRANRAFMAPWDPVRDESYFTVEGQCEVVVNALAEHDQGRSLPHVIVDEAGRVVGRITLSGIVYGPLRSCSVGYWVAKPSNGRGLATAAVGAIKQVAFEELGLHRIQAETLTHNEASQRVLLRNGFTRYGLAPEYLNVAGRWQDHVMFQVVNPSAAHG
jgi:ribosomal-protein-alanine N-acetyltransferase